MTGIPHAVPVPLGYRVGRWEVREPLASGAFATVYAARPLDGGEPRRAAVEETTSYAATRRLYNAPLSELDSVKQKLGQMQSSLMTAGAVAYHAVDLLDRDQPCDPQLMNAKLVNVESSLDSARLAMEVHAACGLFTDLPIERYVRDAHHIYAPAGTSDVQRLRLAEVALGVTKGEPWSSRFAGRTAA